MTKCSVITQEDSEHSDHVAWTLVLMDIPGPNQPMLQRDILFEKNPIDHFSNTAINPKLCEIIKSYIGNNFIFSANNSW